VKLRKLSRGEETDFKKHQFVARLSRDHRSRALS